MPSFCPKSKMHELKICRGVICNDTKKWWKIVRGIDLPFQNWHKEFDEFGLENLKVLKLYTLMGCFWPKYIMFKLKKYRGVVFHGTREWCKTWRKAELWFGTFSPVHKKVSKFGLLLSRFIQSRKYLNFFSWNFVWFSQKEPIKKQNFRLLTAQVKFHQICTLIGSFVESTKNFSEKSTEEFCLTILKSETKFEEKPICCFKNDKISPNFDPSTQMSQKCALWLLSLVQKI